MLVAACLASLVMAGLVLGVGVNPAGALPFPSFRLPSFPFPSLPYPYFPAPETLVVNCSGFNVQSGPSANLQSSINSAPAGSTLLVSGVCYGNFTIGKSLTLQGSATLNGNGSGTVLTISTSGNVALNNLVIEAGSVGGIYVSSGAVTLDNSTVAGNTSLTGGGVFNHSTMTITNSTVSNNLATVNGGASTTPAI